MSLLFPMPMVQFGGLPRITTFFPEFFWLGGMRIRMVPEPHCQDWGGKLLTSARSCIAEPLWLYVNLIRIRSCCYKRKGGNKQTQNKFRSSLKVRDFPPHPIPLPHPTNTQTPPECKSLLGVGAGWAMTLQINAPSGETLIGHCSFQIRYKLLEKLQHSFYPCLCLHWPCSCKHLSP